MATVTAMAMMGMMVPAAMAGFGKNIQFHLYIHVFLLNIHAFSREYKSDFFNFPSI